MSDTPKNSLKLSSLTIFSRILGLIRNHYQAIFFGTGPVAFAWEMAMFLPGTIRNLLVEGSLAQAFVPVYARSLEHSQERAQRTASIVIGVVCVMSLLVMLFCALGFPYLLPIITQQTRSQADFMVYLSWLLLLFMLPASLTAVLAGIANTHRHFVMPALSPILLNLGLLLGFLSLDLGDDAKYNAQILAYVFIASAVIQLLIQYIYLWRNGFCPKFSLNVKHPAFRQIFQLVIPAILSTAVFHINQIIDIIIASYFIPLELGAVPALRFAHRLVQLPTGIVGVALSTAILPILSHYLVKKQEENKYKETIDALHFSLFLTVPAVLGLFFLGEDIINVLFYGGQWDLHSTQVTWEALRFYILGIPFYSLNKIMVAIFFAFKDTKVPMRAMIIATICNFLLNLSLVQVMQHSGIALSTAITAAIYFLQMLLCLQTKYIRLSLLSFLAFLKRNLGLWLVLLLFLFALNTYFADYLREFGILCMHWLGADEIVRYQALPKVMVGAIGGAILYLLLAWLTHNKEFDAFAAFFKNRKANRD